MTDPIDPPMPIDPPILPAHLYPYFSTAREAWTQWRNAELTRFRHLLETVTNDPGLAGVEHLFYCYGDFAAGFNLTFFYLTTGSPTSTECERRLFVLVDIDIIQDTVFLELKGSPADIRITLGSLFGLRNHNYVSTPNYTLEELAPWLKQYKAEVYSPIEQNMIVPDMDGATVVDLEMLMDLVAENPTALAP